VQVHKVSQVLKTSLAHKARRAFKDISARRDLLASKARRE